MAEEIISFDDYVSQLTKKLRSLRHFERCVFSAWCAEYLLTTHGAVVEQSLSASDLRTLRHILDEIWDVLLTGAIPTTKMLNVIDGEFMETGPDDLRVAKDVQPIATFVQSCVGLCILGCRRNDVVLSQKVSEAVIDVVGCELAEKNPDFATNSLERVFEYPEMKTELEIQQAMIRHLGKQYSLDETLRSLFRE